MAHADGLVLVTGAGGFIGSHVVDALVACGRGVRALDLLHDRAHATQPDYLNPEAEWVFGDVRDADTVERCLEGVQAVCHQAAMVGLGLDFGDVTAYVSHNDGGTAALLAGLDRTGFGGRLVLASSMVVYGEGRYLCPGDGEVAAPPREASRLEAGEFEPPCPRCGAALQPRPVGEQTPPDPRNVYAATKLHQEHLCSVFARERGASLVILRYHNVYGPRMPRDTPYAGVASLFRSALAVGQAPRVFEDGAQLRDFVHVRDVAAANLAALDADRPPGTYNIASGTPRSVLEMARALAAAVGPAAPQPRVTGEYRLGDVRHVFASTDRARLELLFEAGEGFEAGMAEFASAPLRDPVDVGVAQRSAAATYRP
jgi:dTDP-L-rhamnose 4-epimerase